MLAEQQASAAAAPTTFIPLALLPPASTAAEVPAGPDLALLQGAIAALLDR